jgi:hypothetical protein
MMEWLSSLFILSDSGWRSHKMDLICCGSYEELEASAFIPIGVGMKKKFFVILSVLGALWQEKDSVFRHEGTETRSTTKKKLCGRAHTRARPFLPTAEEITK